MQSPTPPTKPTPPTPPSMKPSSITPSTDIPSAAATTQKAITTPKAAAKSPSDQQLAPTDPNSISQSASNVPPYIPVSNSNNTPTETTSGSSITPTTQIPQKSPSSMGFHFFFSFIFIIAIALLAIHLWKNHKPKQQSIIDYSTESSDEIVDLILSQHTLEPVPQQMQKKMVSKPKTSSKTNGSFEVRI